MRKFCLAATTLLLLMTCAAAKDQPKYKTIEVKHFPNAEGVELPPEFSDYLYAELRATLEKKKLAEQFVGEDEVVDPADTTNSAVLEGTVLEYKKGSVVKESLIGFGAGARSLKAHIKLTRRSNKEIIIEKDIKVRALARWDSKTLAKFLATSIAGELKHSD